jgi:hypothetical protein
VLQENTGSGISTNWINAISSPVVDNGTTKTVIITPQSSSRFYRLFKQ